MGGQSSASAPQGAQVSEAWELEKVLVVRKAQTDAGVKSQQVGALLPVTP